ncbi:MAG TPA: hypothetical protein VEQ58_17575 [Polyangiaceae bacterium]|nr:hypothetical protein [Polyangiaceae bacterium]
MSETKETESGADAQAEAQSEGNPPSKDEAKGDAESGRVIEAEGEAVDATEAGEGEAAEAVAAPKKKRRSATRASRRQSAIATRECAPKPLTSAARDVNESRAVRRAATSTPAR